MWMGTYPTTPSYVLSTGELLQDVINSNADTLIGKQVLDKFGTDLPFLPKILSIAKALPLQLHPNRELAHKLHEQDPEKFSDSNHKPEIALALSKFQAFAGFKAFQDIEFLLKLEPLKKYARDGSLNEPSLKKLCSKFLKLSEDEVKQIQEGLAQVPKAQYGQQAYILDLLPEMQAQYSKVDNGILVALICMNYLVLQPGEAIYIPADGIHAWMQGDIVECMARSDNVLNVGFCPRADRDSIDLFTSTLTFHAHKVDDMYLKPVKSEKSRSGRTVDYRPELSEFNLLLTRVDKGESEAVKAVNGPSVMIVTKGSGTLATGDREIDLKEGYIFFVRQGVELSFRAENDLEVHRAYAE